MKRLTRSRSDRVVAGICGGFADYFNVDVVLVRLIWIFFTIIGGSGLLAYIIALVLIPEAPAAENAPAPGRRKHTSLWGLLLIAAGGLVLLQHGSLAHSLLRGFWGFGLNILLAIVLIGAGVYFLSNRQTNLARTLGIESRRPLHLSETDKMLAGVCGGLAASWGLDVTLIRFLWAFGTFLSAGVGVVLYIVLALVLPKPVEPA